MTVTGMRALWSTEVATLPLIDGPVPVRPKDHHGGVRGFRLLQDFLRRERHGGDGLNGQSFCPERLGQLLEAFLHGAQIRGFNRNGGGDHIHGSPHRDISSHRFGNMKQDELRAEGNSQFGCAINHFLGDRAEINRGQEGFHTVSA